MALGSSARVVRKLTESEIESNKMQKSMLS